MFNILIVILVSLSAGVIINVLFFKLPGAKNLFTLNNYCLNCKKNYSFTDYIPFFVFVFKKGRCRKCNDKFPITKLIIEVIATLVIISLYIKFGLTFLFLAFVFLLTILIAVMFIDIKHMIIPDILTFLAIGGGATFIVLNFLFDLKIFSEPEKWWKPLLGIIPGSGFLLLVAIIGILVFGTDDALGMGDVKIFVPIGIFLGLEKCIAAVLLSFILGGVFSIIILITGIAKKKKSIPFAPFIVIASYLTILFGDSLIQYIGTFL